jgi:hypothetical protein
MFPQAFLHFLITLSLIWTAAGAVTLVALLILDYKQGKLW